MRATTTRDGTADDDDDAARSNDGRDDDARRDAEARRRRRRESGAEALTIERARLANAVEHLERSCEALEEAAADDATTRDG